MPEMPRGATGLAAGAGLPMVCAGGGGLIRDSRRCSAAVTSVARCRASGRGDRPRMSPRRRGACPAISGAARGTRSEIRNAAEYFEDIPSTKLPGEMIELAEHILETKTGHFDASEFEDRYENAVVEMLKRKQAGLPPAEQPEAAAPTNVVNLMDALRRSVEAEKPGRAAPSKAAERKKPAKEPERRPAKGARKAG